jgi:Domain of unknown function (DUF4492)
MPNTIITPTKSLALGLGSANRKTAKNSIQKIKAFPGQILTFYLDGFRNMKLGRTLWVIILIKLLIMFGVLKIFFFPDYLEVNFSDDRERAEHVFTNITQIPPQNNEYRRSQ